MQLQQSIQNLVSRPEEGNNEDSYRPKIWNKIESYFSEAYLISNPLEQFTWLSRDHLNVLVYLVCSIVFNFFFVRVVMFIF